MEKDKGSIETSKAVCGPAVRPNALDSVNQNSNEGQPRVGELFFINHEVDDVSLSSLSSDPTAYTETEIVENLTDYPVAVDYALTIAASTNTSISSVTHNGIIRKKLNSRSILTAFKRKASTERTELPGSIPKDWCNNTDPAVNKSSDPTIDIENQPSHEESSIDLDEESVPSESQNSFPSFTDGFSGYIYQNCSELNSRRNLLFIMAALVLLMFGVSAVIAAVTLGSKSDNAEAGNNRLASFYEPSTVTTARIESPTTMTSNAIESNEFLRTTNPKTTMTGTSNDESEERDVTDSSSSTSSTVVITSSASTDATSSSSTTASSSTISTVTTTSTTSTAKASSPARKLSATYLQAVAYSLMNRPKKGDKEVVDVVSYVRFDISPMLTDPRGHPFKVVMRLGSSSSKNVSSGKISVEYLPKAGLWDCSPCEQAQVPSINSISVGNTFENIGESAYMDMVLAFSRGIFDRQMTFKLSSNGLLPAPELVILWVEGNSNDFSDLSMTSLLKEALSGGEGS